VTFVPSPETTIDLAARGIDCEQAAELRGRLAAFAEDWQRPEMDAYDCLSHPNIDGTDSDVG
jgi:hypothetical protein